MTALPLTVKAVSTPRQPGASLSALISCWPSSAFFPVGRPGGSLSPLSGWGAGGPPAWAASVAQNVIRAAARVHRRMGFLRGEDLGSVTRVLRERGVKI